MYIYRSHSRFSLVSVELQRIEWKNRPCNLEIPLGNEQIIHCNPFVFLFLKALIEYSCRLFALLHHFGIIIYDFHSFPSFAWVSAMSMVCICVHSQYHFRENVTTYAQCVCVYILHSKSVGKRHWLKRDGSAVKLFSIKIPSYSILFALA